MMNRKEFARTLLSGGALAGVLPYVPSGSTKVQSERSEGFSFAPGAGRAPGFSPLFNGRNMDGFVDMNTSPETWWVEDELLKCTGEPIGVIRTERQYENFLLDIEWRHMEPGGNSGVFILADGVPFEDRPFPTGMEVQMLDTQWPVIHERPTEYAQGHLFPVMGLEGSIPDNQSEVASSRSASLEDRVHDTGEWNRYLISCIDGVIKLSINGRFVNGIHSTIRKKGYICPESEGFEIHFRRFDLLELPEGVLEPHQSADKVS
ncbi:MAG: 3-keto-disaccharide hydrolase [Bacteroidota bacterium]